MFFQSMVFLTFFCFQLSSQPAFVYGEDISKEDKEIIQNLELLEGLEIFQSEDWDLAENYDEVKSLTKDEGVENENEKNH